MESIEKPRLPEKGLGEGILAASESKAVMQIKQAWTGYGPGFDPGHYYAVMLKVFGRLDYTAKDVEDFSLALSGFQKENNFSIKAGVFLSALINSCRSMKFVIHTAHITEPIHGLGMRNRKDITVKGNVGDVAGGSMIRGTITVEGNAGASVGVMMNGGTITVKGNAGNNAGQDMRGGEIHIEGEVGSIAGKKGISRMIYQRGELIEDIADEDVGVYDK